MMKSENAISRVQTVEQPGHSKCSTAQMNQSLRVSITRTAQDRDACSMLATVVGDIARAHSTPRKSHS